MGKSPLILKMRNPAGLLADSGLLCCTGRAIMGLFKCGFDPAVLPGCRFCLIYWK
jgi:hypothetical protein